MTKDKYVISKTKRYPYYILMFAILIWFVAMEIFGTNERMIDMSADSLIYSGSFTWQKLMDPQNLSMYPDIIPFPPERL